MATKQAVCCARRTSKLHHDQNSLRILAQKAASHSARGHDITRFKELIAKTKAMIEVDKLAVADHEAEHAAGVAPGFPDGYLTALAKQPRSFA